jgi:hypothetical protein
MRPCSWGSANQNTHERIRAGSEDSESMQSRDLPELPGIRRFHDVRGGPSIVENEGLSQHHMLVNPEDRFRNATMHQLALPWTHSAPWMAAPEQGLREKPHLRLVLPRLLHEIGIIGPPLGIGARRMHSALPMAPAFPKTKFIHLLMSCKTWTRSSAHMATATKCFRSRVHSESPTPSRTYEHMKSSGTASLQSPGSGRAVALFTCSQDSQEDQLPVPVIE